MENAASIEIGIIYDLAKLCQMAGQSDVSLCHYSTIDNRFYVEGVSQEALDNALQKYRQSFPQYELERLKKQHSRMVDVNCARIASFIDTDQEWIRDIHNKKYRQAKEYLEKPENNPEKYYFLAIDSELEKIDYKKAAENIITHYNTVNYKIQELERLRRKAKLKINTESDPDNIVRIKIEAEKAMDALVEIDEELIKLMET